MKNTNKRRFGVLEVIYICTTLLLVGGLIAALASLNIKNEQKQSQDYFKEYYDKKVAAFAVENANYAKGQNVFIGDSITDLYHLDEYYSDLDKATYNRGIGGDTTIGVLNRLDVSLYQIVPSNIVLMIGINDINSGYLEDDIIARYTSILDNIKSNLPSSKLFAMSILPMHDAMQGYIDLNKNTEIIISINSKIKLLAEERSYQYMDLFSLVKDEDNHLIKAYSDDGIHLNDAGFRVWTDLVKPVLI